MTSADRTVLFQRYIWLSRKMAGRRAAGSRECHRDDLYQMALIAVWEASLRYDPVGEANFMTFAMACIRNKMSTFLRDEYSRAPLGPSLDEGMGSEYGEDEDGTYGDLMPDNRGYQVSESTQYLEDQIREMAPFCAEYSLDGYTLEEITERVGQSHRTMARKLAVERDRMREELDLPMAEEVSRHGKGGLVYKCPRVASKRKVK